MYLKTLSLGDIHPYERNPRINDKAVEPVMKSIQKDGYRARIIVDKDGVIIAGHTRYEAMKRLGWTEAEVWIADDMTPEQIADYRIRDNLTADFAEWDFGELEAEIEALDLDFDMSEFEGFEDFQGAEDTDNQQQEERKGSLASKYLVPPFSVIYANKPDWLQRKRAWVDMGLHSEIGRGVGLAYNSRSNPEANFIRKSGGGIMTSEKSKAFKNNARLNSYMTKAKHIPTA
jgi:hypothetical protein